ncbi:heterogeneous nuclear ribonucleoprotein D0 [Anabrus simplex]|uniref:heterogeneous nuclear ribonucleoprotein D0 n=1 Tax=Anabrus simplex TaxID=316456 RepID=UPI0034DCFCE7
MESNLGSGGAEPNSGPDSVAMDQSMEDGGSSSDQTGRGSSGIPGRDDERKLFVGGLSRQTTDRELREYFSKFGEIENITLKMDPHTGLSRGFAFIVFSNPETIDKLLGCDHYINHKKVDPKRISKECQQGKLFVGGLTPDISDDDIRNFFSQFGTVVDVQSPFDKVKNQRKGFCFITFDSKDTVYKLLKNPKQYINGKWVDLRKAVNNPEAAGGGGGLQGEKIFVGGITPDISDLDIKNFFSQFGTVVEVQSPYDKAKNQRKGFCFITFDSKDAVYNLLKNPKQYINGKAVDLRIAVTNPESTWGTSANGWQGGKIFVGGLTPDITDAEIRKFFSQYGPVIEVQSPYDKAKNQRKGFCFITFASKDAVHKLLKNPVKYINGKKVDLRMAVTDPDSSMEGGNGWQGDWPGRYGGYGSGSAKDYSNYGSDNDYPIAYGPDTPPGLPRQAPPINKGVAPRRDSRQFFRYQPY